MHQIATRPKKKKRPYFQRGLKIDTCPCRNPTIKCLLTTTTTAAQKPN